VSGLYIRKFIDRVQACESKGVDDFVWPLADARNLHGDITKLLLDIELLTEHNKNQEVVQVEVTGGDW
tara:strand:+ start:963 stop:1166 length:204 start_codon:yes stop_codon:yes gene_type:complete